jgi:O-acetyl-ADP-ribose deacetylase (regulator of RNase III)
VASDRVIVKVGDITREDVDAIVNAANSSLLGGGGVDGAIHRAGGPEILEACRRLRQSDYPQGLPTGEAVITTGGRLVARHVIHTVGPVYGQHGGDEARLLGNCYRSAIALAARHALETLAFPAISTGVYGYPREEAARVASAAIDFALTENSGIREVRLVFFSEDDARVFLSAAPR